MYVEVRLVLLLRSVVEGCCSEHEAPWKEYIKSTECSKK